jgi:enoyl-CoA hydratase/carnithine racemase
MDVSSAKPILVDHVAPHVAMVTLNRPDKRNAVNGDLAEALEAATRALEADEDIWVCVLTSSSDQAFCAGADLSEVSQGKHRRQVTRDGGFAGFVEFEKKKPWIAAVSGPALAGGFEICLACDLIVAAENAVFGLPEVKRGLIAGAGGVQKSPRALPKAIAIELIITGDPITAQRGYELGLINAVTPIGEAHAKAISLAERIALASPVAVRESLAIARLSNEAPLGELHRMTKQAFSRLFQTEDFKEGPRAFLEKRVPRWTGR